MKRYESWQTARRLMMPWQTTGLLTKAIALSALTIGSLALDEVANAILVPSTGDSTLKVKEVARGQLRLKSRTSDKWLQLPGKNG